MTKEKRILSYTVGYFLVGLFICLIGISNVLAEEIEPTTGFRSQIGTLKTDGTIFWNASSIGGYGSQLSFGTGPTYSTYGIPAYMRLSAITDVNTNYSYKISYNMTIFTPYSSSNTWDSTKIDSNYNLIVGDDAGVVKESKCTVSNTDIIDGNEGTFTTKSISCVVTINKDYSNLYLSAGYYCKNCELSGLEPLGYVPQDSYMYITSPTLERFNDNSNIIIDQNQTIIDQNNKTNEELGNLNDNLNQSTEDLKDTITESNQETQDVIKDQFNDCFTYDIKLTNNDRLQSGYIKEDGTIVNSNDYGISDYVKIYGGYSYSLSKNYYGTVPSIVFYDKDKNYVMGIPFNNLKDFDFTLPKEISYFRITLPTSDDKYSVIISTTEICSNKIDETNDKLGNLNDSLNDSNVDGSLDSAGSFFDNFTTTDHGGLSGIITAPLVAINEMLNTSCSPMTATFKGKELSLPCGYEFWNRLGAIQDFVNIVLGGMLCYQIIIKLYKLIERIKNPEDDRLEVMDL